MSEVSLWRYLKEGMRGRWDACRHTEALSSGVPDVSFGIGGRNGWIELKARHSWPKRADTPVDFDLRLDQAAWLSRRQRYGDNVWILVRCAREYLLFSGAFAKAISDRLPRERLYTLCSRRWVGRIVWSEFEEELLK